MNKFKKALVCVIGYDRVDTLVSILKQVDNLEMSERQVDIIVSIDHSPIQSKIKLTIGKLNLKSSVIFIYQPKKLGLKEHILRCGDLVNQSDYEYIVLLEDDLYVSKYALQYVEKCLSIIDDNIAGISLYKYSLDEEYYLPFNPIQDGYDNHFIKYAASWGQVWTPNMWNKFRKWLLEYDCESFDDNLVPNYICQWSNDSWKKHFIRYLSHNDKYFIYPNVSLTSNIGVNGVHQVNQNQRWDVPILEGDKHWQLSRFEQSNSVYNQWFSNTGMVEYTQKQLVGQLYNKNPLSIFTYVRLLLMACKQKIKRTFRL